MAARVQATDVAPLSPEPQQVRASLQYELGDTDAALHLLQESMSKWWPKVQRSVDVGGAEDGPAQLAAADGVSPQQAAAETCAQPGPSAAQDPQASLHVTEQAGAERECGSNAELPSYEFRVECCKLLLELDSSTDTVLQVCCHSPTSCPFQSRRRCTLGLLALGTTQMLVPYLPPDRISRSSRNGVV